MVNTKKNTGGKVDSLATLSDKQQAYPLSGVRAGSIPPALKQQAIDESVPYTDILEANKQK